MPFHVLVDVSRKLLQLRLSRHEVSYKSQVTRYRLQATGYTLYAIRYKLLYVKS